MSGHKSKKRGSNIICRVSNATPEMVCQYVKRLPKHKMTEKAFRDYMGKRWFQNEHQAPEQWGLYYIDGKNYYPRFNKNVTLEEAERYLLGWIKRLIVINPYTNFKSSNDCRLVESIVKELETNPQEHDLKTIISKILNSDEPFIVNEIIANALNNYSEVLNVEVIDNDKEKFHVSLLPNYQEILKTKYNMTKKEYYESFSDIDTNAPLDAPNQIIFYGAPGTGKSDTIKREVDDKKRVRHRITFHPDSDYSTFVGTYKPTMIKRKQIVLDYEGMVDKLKEYLDEEPVNITRACTLFGYDYHDSIVKMQESGNHSIPDLVTDAYKSGTTYDTQVRAGMSLYESTSNNNQNSKIVYKFIPQAFTNAYVDAWNTEQPVFLIIEEINRGNCAQIFGDLFQLLDRKNGFSEYPIKADTDLANYLSDKLGKSPRNDIPDVVKKGEWLMLPSNLYIWATMNTSDQSLFPIDSAFKRRWEWRYIKIANGYKKDENGEYAVDEEGKKIPLGWKLEINNQDWWAFIQQINTIISSMTMSADKQLGYFFCKADDNGIISKEVFVNKVLFYLWNDVFKDYAEEDSSLFKYKVDPEDKDFADLTFPDFFKENGKIEDSVVEEFVKNVMTWKKDEQTKQDS